MGAGKSYLGKQIAERLSMEFLDTDSLIEAKEQRTISSIFETDGEDVFRQMEKDCLGQLIEKQTDCVIATGGGLPCFHNNAERMRRSGLVIHLQAGAELLCQNLLEEMDQRPLLTGKKSDLASFLCKQYEERAPFYEKAHIFIHLKSRDTGTESLIRRLYPFFQNNEYS